jgi:hypothetical protein
MAQEKKFFLNDSRDNENKLRKRPLDIVIVLSLDSSKRQFL